MANGNWWDKYKTGGAATAPEEGDAEPAAQDGNWWDKYKPAASKPEQDPNKQLLSSWDEATKEFGATRKSYEQLGARYQELGAKEARTPEEEQELQTTWNSLLNSGFSVQSAQNKVAELQPQIERFNERQKQNRIDYIEDRRGSGVFGDEAAEALYDIDARAEQEYEQARTIEDTDKRKEAMAAIQAKYQAEEKTLTNQYIERFKEGETKINNAAEVIGQAFAKGQTVDQFLLETGADAAEFSELRDSLLNQDDPEKGRLFREARAMVDLAEGAKKVGIVNNEIRISPLHVWDGDAIKSEINALDISDAKKRTAIATIPQLQQEAAKVEYPFLKENVSEFNSFVKDNNLENVSPQRQIAEWKGRNDGWLSNIPKTFKQAGIGLTTGTLGLLEAGQAIVGGTASIMGAQEFADPFLDAATKTSDEVQRLTRISQEIGGPTFAAELAAVVPQIITQIAVGGAVGFGGTKLGLKPKTVSNLGFGSSVGTAMAQSYGGVLSSAFQTLEKEKIDAGMDPVQARAEAVKEAQLPAALSGLATAAVTAIGGKRGVEAPFREGVGGIKAKLNTAAFRAELPKLIPDVVKGMRNEGYEEFVDQLAQGIIEQFTFNPELSTSDIINNAVKALVIGGITGGTVEGLKYGFDYMKAPKAMARREKSMASIRQSIADAEQDISNISASSPIGSEFQREYDATLPSDEAANLGGVAVDRTRINTLQAERQQLSELLEDDTISKVARNQLEGKLAAADIAYYNEVLVPMRRNVVNEQMVDQLDGMVVSQQTKDGITAMAKIANGLGAESLTGRERVAVGITSIGGGRFIASKKNPMVEVSEAGEAKVTEAGRLMAENVGMVPLVRMIGLSESTRAKQAEMERVLAETEARKAQQEAKDTAESEEAKRYGPASAEALKQQVAVQPPVPEKESNARLAQLLKEQEEAARLGEEAVARAVETRFIESFRSTMSESIIPTAERAATIDLNAFQDVINSIAREIDKGTFNIELIEQGEFKNILPEQAFTTVVEAFKENPQRALNALRAFGDEVENAVKEFGGGAAGEPPENLEPLRRVVRTEQTPEDVTALTEAGLIEIYKDQPVITEAGLEILPEAERPRLTPEARKIQIDTGANEVVAEAISKGLRIGVDQVGPNVTMPQGWTLDGDIYVPPAPPVEPPVQPPVTPPVAPPPVAPTAGAITEEQANNAIKAAQEARAAKPAPTIGRTRWGPQSVAPKQSIGKTVREALKTASRLNLSKIAQSNPNEIMMQDVAAILAELDMPILDLEPIVSLSSLGKQGRPRRFPRGKDSVVGLPSTISLPVEILVHEIGHTITADQIKQYLPREKFARGKGYLDAINKAIADPKTPEPISRLFSLYVSTIEQLGIDDQYFAVGGIAGGKSADESKALAQRAQAKGLIRKDIKSADFYGLANLEEFVSQTFSEPSFRELLKGLKDPNNPRQSLWQAFVDAIQRILQLPKGSMAAAVVEASIDVGMLVEPDRVRARGKAGVTPAPAPEPDMAYAGEQANLPQFMLDSLSVAQAMAARNADPQTIRRITGWIVNPYDKKLRWEIPDNNAQFTNAWYNLKESPVMGTPIVARLGDILSHPPLFKAYPEIADVTIIKRPSFFDLFRSIQGSFDDTANQIIVTPYAVDQLSTILHEVQHWIQNRENFARGGNTEKAMRVLTANQKAAIISEMNKKADDMVEILKKRRDEAWKLRDHLRGIQAMPEKVVAFDLAAQEKQRVNAEWRKVMDLPTGDPQKTAVLDADKEAQHKLWRAAGIDPKDALQMWDIAWPILRAESLDQILNETDAEFNKLEKDISSSYQIIADASKGDDEFEAAIDKFDLSHELYRRVAGEIEARDVQSRAGMTPEERAASEPYSSENIAPELAIVTFTSPSSTTEEVDIDMAPEPRAITPQTPSPIESIFDARTGMGQVPFNVEIGYRGFVKYMTPSEFRSLVPKGVSGPETKRFVVEALGRGEKLGQPFLNVVWNETDGVWEVADHEGRSRVDAILDVYGDVPIPVHMFPRDLRAADITDQMRNASFISQADQQRWKFDVTKPYVKPVSIQTPQEVSAITSQQDRDYLDAVERGDLDAASRVVEDAAKAVGVPTIGVNINDGEQSFTEQILNGDKTIETRDSENNALAGLVGQRIAIVRTGKGKAKVVGYATVGDPIRYTSKSQFDADYNKHLVSGGRYGFKGFKIGYPMLDVERIDAYDAPPATGVIKTRPIHAPIERDDQGNIIPPSQRFQPEDADIRYNPLGYDITTVVEDIKAGRTDGPLRAINNVVKESTELRDRIKRESQKRQKPRARGQAPILERIARERSSGKISEETAQALTDFVNTIRPDAIGDTSISIRGAGAVSNYDFGNNLVSFYLTQDQPEMGARIGIHEFWHGLSRFLPKNELAKMSEDYTRELIKFIDANPWFLAFVGRYSLTPEQFEAYKIFNPKEAETKLSPVFDANGEITKYNIRYDRDNYRYIMLDEWIAESMTDLVRQRQEIPDTFLGKLAKIFFQFLDLIESKLGLDAYESFYQLVTDPKKKLQLYRNESVARPFQIYQPQTYNYGRDVEGLIRFNALAPEPEVRDASQKHSDAMASNKTDEAQRLSDKVAAIRKYKSQNLLFHGTTHIFNVFRKDRVNIENDFGKGYYLTNTEADAEINYAGEGPDLTSRIERLSEQLEENENLTRAEALKKATEILSGGGQRIMRVYVRLENPFNVGGPNETFLDYETPYDETTEEYGEPTGKLAEFLQALRPIIESYSEYSAVDADKAVSNIAEYALDRGGISASDLVRILKQEYSGIIYANDENGDMANGEIIRQAIEDSGFDGIVDSLVNQKFGRSQKKPFGMKGMGPDTVHTIVFNSSQIKSADAATYDDDGNLIPLSQRFLAEEEDVRFAPEEEFEVIPEQVEDQIEGTPEAAVIKVMGQVFQMADEQSATMGTPQGTLPLETITSAWMNSGRDVETLENAIIRYTNLEPEAAATLAEAIGKQVKIQRGIMEISDAASRRKAEKEEEPEVKPYSFAKRIKSELAPDVRNKINLTYEVLRNEVSVQEANAAMSGLTLEESVKATLGEASGISLPVRTMMALITIRKFMDRRKSLKGKKGKEAEYEAVVEAHVDFVDEVDKYFKELGQGVQAISQFSNLGADGTLVKLRKDTNKAIEKHITNRKGQIDKIKRDVEEADNAAFNAAIKSNKANIDKTAKKAGEQEAKKLTIEEQAQKLAIRAAKKVAGEEVRRRQPDPLSDLVNNHLRRYNANFIAEATAMGVSPATAQAIEDSAIKLRDSRQSAKAERERFKEMQEERMKVKKELARENKYIYGPRPTIWENYQDMFSERLARRLMRDPKNKVPPSLLLFTDRLTENLLGFVPEVQRQATTQRSFQAAIEDALNNKEKYQEAFNRALEDISFKVMELEAKAAFGEKVPSETYKKAVAAQEFLERLELIIQQFPVSDKLVMRFVNQKMKAMGESLVARYNDWYRSSIKTRIEIEKALAEKLVADMNVSNADAVNLSRAIIKDFRAKAEERREKALARFKKPKEKTKRLAQSPLKKFFELVNIGAMTDKDAYEVMAHRFELPTWDPKFAKQIEEMALIIEDMPEGLERRRLTRNMMAEIARRKGFSLSDLGSGFFYSNMLSDIETFLINFYDTLLGNWVNGLSSSVAEKDFTRLNGLMDGYRKGWREAINVFQTGLRINMPRLEEKTPLTVELINYGRKGGVALESTEGMNAIAKTLLESPPAKVLNLWKYVTRIMEATDALNYTASSEGQRYAEAAKMAKDEGLEGKEKQKRINQILNLGDDVYQAALKQAEQEGYTGNDAKFRAMEIQDSKIDAEIREKSFDRALTDVYRNMPTGLAGFTAAQFNNITMRIANPWFRNAFKLFIAPFVITPTNLFNRWLDYSPYGYKRLFYGSGNLLDKDTPYYVAPPKVGSAEFYTQALKASSSVMVMGLAYGLVKAGLLVLRGMGPSDEEERKQWLDDGNRPHTFSFMGGPQISYQYTPWALVLSWMANYQNWEQYNAKEDASGVERGIVAMTAATSIIMDLPFFAGPAEFMNAIQGGRGAVGATLQKYAEGKMGMVFPNLVRKIDRIFDPTLYDSQGLKGIIIDQMPFARRLGTQRVNLFGDPIGEDKPTMDRLVGRIISFPPKPSRESRILAKYDIYPYMPSPKEAKALVDGEQAQMTEEQYNKFVQIVGKDVKKRINDMFDPEGEITEQERERGKKRISQIFERARARGVREVSTY